mgnify:CR=1 FL=1
MEILKNSCELLSKIVFLQNLKTADDGNKPQPLL